MKLILALLVVTTSSLTRAADLKTLRSGLEKTLGVTLSANSQRVEGTNCIVQAGLRTIDGIEVPQVYVGVFDKETYSVKNAFFDPGQPERCEVQVNTSTPASSVSALCLTSVCEEQGCVDNEDRITINSGIIKIRDLGCRLH